MLKKLVCLVAVVLLSAQLVLADDDDDDTIRSCRAVRKSGVYQLKLNDLPHPIDVYCEAETFNGGWVVIQQRLDGSVDFNRSFAEYRDGFGQVRATTEFWLGLEAIHQLTKKGNVELAVEMKNRLDEYHYARYTDFGVDNEASQYTLNRIGKLSGSATRSNVLGAYAKNGKFYTYDKDANRSPASSMGGGWWVGMGYDGWLNGKYDTDKIYVFFWEGTGRVLKFTRMMVRY